MEKSAISTTLEIVARTREKYIEAYQKLVGEDFAWA